MHDMIWATAILILVGALIFTSIRARRNLKLARKYSNLADKWRAQVANQNSMAHNFVDSCRLIAIHRDGRLNVFTFARGDKTFMIETMGLLSDTPDEWRVQAGLAYPKPNHADRAGP